MKLEFAELKYANKLHRTDKKDRIRAKYTLEQINGEDFEDLYEFYANFTGDLIHERNILNEQLTALYKKEAGKNSS